MGESNSYEPPTVNSLLIAEHVYQDAQSGKWIVAGVFNQGFFGQLPAAWPEMHIFFQLTNVGRNVDVHLRIEHAATAEHVLEIGGEMNAANPLQIVEQHLVFQGIPFKDEGKYWVQLISREQILAQAPLHIKIATEER